MGEIIKIDSANQGDTEMIRDERGIMDSAQNILSDTLSDTTNRKTLSMPIAQLATLGAGVSSLLPALRTITQTTTIETQGLYRLANEAVGDTLKVAKNGNFWGAFKTAEGTSKFAQLQAAGPLTATTEAVAAVNPAIMLMAVALFSVEQQLGEIKEMQEQIIAFLEIEKEAEIEADVKVLSDILEKYKTNWDNEYFISNNHKLVLDIQRTAQKNIDGYQKKVNGILKGKKLALAHVQVNMTLKDLLKKFKYYRLSLYTFSMASLMEIMLSGNFREEYILGIKTKIEKMSMEYRELFQQCSVVLEKMSEGSIDTNILKGIGTASKAVGKLIGSIPVVKEGPVDEFLEESGASIRESAEAIESGILQEFALISNPQTGIYTAKMEDMIQIYNHTEQICFDENKIYLIAG